MATETKDKLVTNNGLKAAMDDAKAVLRKEMKQQGGGSNAGATAEQLEQIQKNTEAIETLSKEIDAVNESVKLVKAAESSGVSSSVASALLSIFKSIDVDESNATAYASAYTALESALGGKTVDDGGKTDDTPTEVTLSSITATYSGGDVAVGTAVTDLTGVTVTGKYSDGTSKAITGYSLSGTIAEGSNTITVTYSGKIATFAVTGVAQDTQSMSIKPFLYAKLNQSYLNWYEDDGTTKSSGTITTDNGSNRTAAISTAATKDGTINFTIDKIGNDRIFDYYHVGATDWDGEATLTSSKEYSVYNHKGTGADTYTTATYSHTFTLPIKKGQRLFVSGYGNQDFSNESKFAFSLEVV